MFDLWIGLGRRGKCDPEGIQAVGGGSVQGGQFALGQGINRFEQTGVNFRFRQGAGQGGH